MPDNALQIDIHHYCACFMNHGDAEDKFVDLEKGLKLHACAPMVQL